MNFGRNLFRKFSQTFSMVKYNVVFVLGPPGSGKGTQCSKIVEGFNYVHLSAGDLLREEKAKPGSEFGELIENYIVDGKIVPAHITISLLERAMKNSSKDHFLIDGFPRNEDNLQQWNDTMNEKTNLKFVLFFDCPSEVCIQRCLNRGLSGGRSDDNEESLKKRFDTYMNSSMPIINRYENEKMVRRIDATSDPDKIFESVQKVFS